MAGKRYDQYQIANSEAQSTDYKRFPQDTHGQTSDMDTPAGDKHNYAQSRKEIEGQPFPPDVPAPSVEARRGTKLLEDNEHLEEEIIDEPGAKDTESGKGNPLV